MLTDYYSPTLRGIIQVKIY